jgi:hypothetical protein
MKWGQLKSQAATYVHRKDIDWDAAQVLLASDLDARLNTVVNEGVAALTLSTSAGIPGFYSVVVPSNYARVKTILRNTSEVKASGESAFFTRPDKERFFTQVGLELYFAQSAPCILLYAKRVQLMASDADENVEATYYPNVYLYGLLTHAAKLMADFELIGVHEQTYENWLERANAASDEMRYSAGFAPTIVGGSA